jgi:hypothetical protein
MSSEDKKDEVVIYSKDDLTFALQARQTSSPVYGEIEFTADDYRTALRLLVGAALELNDELRYQLKMWLISVQKREQERGAEFLGAEGMGGSALLYTVFGLLYKTAERVNRGASTAGRISARTTSLASRLAKPITHSRVLRPVRRSYHALGRRWQSVFTPLEETGRSKARSSRALVHQEFSEELVEEFLIYLVERSKLREMIVETSAEVGSDALTDVRGRSASVDSSLDDMVDNLLRRQKPKMPASDSLS